MKKHIVIWILICIPLVTSASNQDAATVYEWMTKLQGEWKLADQQEGKATEHKLVKPLLGTETTAMAFKTIGKGSTVQEDLLPTTQKHMATMYHCEDGSCKDVRATHYCAKQNQPRMLANLAESSPNKIVYDCDMRTALCQSKEDHVHKITHEISEDGKELKTSYASWKNGEYTKSSVYKFVRK